jgi:hypothetical protein
MRWKVLLVIAMMRMTFYSSLMILLFSFLVVMIKKVIEDLHPVLGGVFPFVFERCLRRGHVASWRDSWVGR